MLITATYKLSIVKTACDAISAAKAKLADALYQTLRRGCLRSTERQIDFCLINPAIRKIPEQICQNNTTGILSELRPRTVADFRIEGRYPRKVYNADAFYQICTMAKFSRWA